MLGVIVIPLIIIGIQPMYTGIGPKSDFDILSLPPYFKKDNIAQMKQLPFLRRIIRNYLLEQLLKKNYEWAIDTQRSI